MTSIHPRHHVKRRRRTVQVPLLPALDKYMRAVNDAFFPFRNALYVSPEVAGVVKGLRMSAPAVDRRMLQATRLEAAQVSDELVNIICKIAAQGVVTNDDINQLHRHAAGGPRP